MSKSLIIYFSRADENYSVGYIKKGNTEIVAEYISELTGADMFKVERKKPYPVDYNSCIKDAQIEQQRGERPELLKELQYSIGTDSVKKIKNLIVIITIIFPPFLVF